MWHQCGIWINLLNRIHGKMNTKIMKLFAQTCSRCRVMTFKQTLSSSGRKPPSCLLSVWLEVTQQFPVQHESTAEMMKQITAGNISVSRSCTAWPTVGTLISHRQWSDDCLTAVGKKLWGFTFIWSQVTSVAKTKQQMLILNWGLKITVSFIID